MKYFKVTLLLLIFMGCIKFNYSQEKKDNTNHSSCVFGSITGNNFDAVGYLYYLDPKLKEIPYEFDPDSSFGKVYISRLQMNSIGFNGFPGISDRNKCFAVDYHGFFYIDTACEYSLGLSSKGLARLFVDGIIWSEHNDRDSYQNIGDALGVSGGIFLEEGIHEINLQYFHYNNKEIYCRVDFGKSGEESRIMDLSKFKSIQIQNTITDSFKNNKVFSINMLSSILFKINDVELSRDAKRFIDKIFQGFPMHTDTIHLVIEGYTDDLGSLEYNNTLSINRAINVGEYIKSNYPHIGKVHTIGFGESNPKYQNSNEENRAKNRRIEIKIMNAKSFLEYAELHSLYLN